MNYLVRDRDVIFNLAGQVSHIDSMRDPYTDLEINCRSQLTLLEACRYHNPRRQGGVRRHAPGLRPARLPAGRRDASRAADRRQRHQQGGGRVLPSRLQQRLRRARLLAAADQRLRPAAADQAQPPGLHRLVHPPRDRGPRRSRSTATARRSATSSTWTMRPTRSCAPGASDACNGEVFNVGGDEPISHRDLTDAARRDRRHRARRIRRLAGREEGDRHRRLLRRLDEVQARRPAGSRTVAAARRAARTIEFYREHLDHYVDRRRDAAGARVTRPRVPFLSLAPREDAAAPSAPRSTASSRSGWFVLGPEVEAFEREFAAASGARARRRRRHRHRRARAHPARARHRPRRRSHHHAAVGGLHRARHHDGRRAAGLRRHRSGAPDDRSGSGSSSADHPADARHPAGASVRPGRRHGGDRADRGAARPRARRRLLPGAPRHRRRAAGRHHRRRRRVQLLSDQEPRRARRRRRRRHQRSRARRARSGGCATAARRDRYHHEEAGVNSRLDEMQAAILRARLPFLPRLDGAAAGARGAAIGAARRIAPSIVPPELDRGHVYHLFVVLARRSDASATLQQHLARRGIETLVHYPVPIPRQPALGRHSVRPMPGRRPRCATRCCRCRSIRR